MHRNLSIFLIALACLFSGFTLSASTGKGFVLLALPLVTVVVALHLARRAQYRSWWIVGVLGFLLITATNGSRPGSVFLIVAAMVLVEVLRLTSRQETVTRLDTNLLLLVILALLALALLDLAVLGRNLGLWSTSGKFAGLPRLKFWFSEPSYLGTFAAALFFVIPRFGVRVALLAVLAMTQSYYAAAYFALTLGRRHLLLVISVCSVIAFSLYLQAKDTVDFFFQNSGFVRLVGISIFDNISLHNLLFGRGLGAGDAALEDLFEMQGAEIPNGFLFSLIFDVGVVGIAFLYMAYVKKPFDAIRLTFLLLNFGAGSFLVPVLMSLRPPNKSFADESRIRIRLAQLERSSA